MLQLQDSPRAMAYIRRILQRVRRQPKITIHLRAVKYEKSVYDHIDEHTEKYVAFLAQW